MYLPKQYEENQIPVMWDLIRTYPLATLVTMSSGSLNADHIPMILSESPLPFGTLRGHVARANPLSGDIIAEIDSLAVFHGPDAYISPSWYETKKETGKVVPTWNYAVVHAYGRLRIIDDAAWLRTLLEELTTQNEASFPRPWAVSDAPREYTDKLIGSVVGIEMIITRLIGKWKVSQNQPTHNQASVVEKLKEHDITGAASMAGLVEARMKKPLQEFYSYGTAR